MKTTYRRSPAPFSALSRALSVVAMSAAVLVAESALAGSHMESKPDWSKAPKTASGQDFIEVFARLSGPNPGIRKGHARGVCAAGEFTPSEEAKKAFATPLFSSGELPVTVRFSMAGGNPNEDERGSALRGVGIRFEGDPAHHIAGLTSPVFAGKNPQQFLGLLRVNAAIKEGKASADDRAAYMRANPEVMALPKWMANQTPSTDYTNISYFGIHTFFADDAAGGSQKFRWQLEPRDTRVALSNEQRENGPEHFLAERLKQRVSEDAPAVFDWYWVLGTDEDPTIDPSKQWPSERERVHAGTVTLSSAGSTACNPVNFDPTQTTQGVQASNDPILQTRSVAYAISMAKRLSGQ